MLYDTDIPTALYLGKDDVCWSCVNSIISNIQFKCIDIDTSLISNLCDIRKIITGTHSLTQSASHLLTYLLTHSLMLTHSLTHAYSLTHSLTHSLIYPGEALDNACLAVIEAIKYRGGALSQNRKILDKDNIRPILKNLLVIGNSLSQSKEFKDFLEDILTLVKEPLESLGLTSELQMTFLTSSIYLGNVIPIDAAVLRASSIGGPYDPALRYARDASKSSPVDSSMMSIEREHSSNRSISGDSYDPLGIDTNTYSKYAGKGPSMRKDWVRFVNCCRMCMMQLI